MFFMSFCFLFKQIYLFLHKYTEKCVRTCIVGGCCEAMKEEALKKEWLNENKKKIRRG